VRVAVRLAVRKRGTMNTIAELEAAYGKVKSAGGLPEVILVRRDSWPALKAELELRCNEANSVDCAGPFGPILVMGIPIRVVDDLPCRWMILPDDLAPMVAKQ